MKQLAIWWKMYVLEPMAMTLAETSWFGFVLSTLLLASAVNIGASLLLQWTGPLVTLSLLIVALTGTIIFANFYFHWRRRRLVEEGQRILGERPHPTPRKGLIVMVTNAPTARKAVDYHLGRLEHVWLITTPGMRDPYNVLHSYLDEIGAKGHLLELDQEYDANRCYYLVRSVFEQFAPRVGLAPSDIIADMTGGTKPMTAGMVLACIDMNAALEHVPTRFSGAGQPMLPLDPIEVIFGHTNPAAG